MTVAYSTANIVVNGDAETGAAATSFSSDVAPEGWAVTGSMTAVTYAAGGSADLNPADGLASQGGTAYFAGGTFAGSSTASQLIDLSQYATRIDAGRLTLNLGAQMGGYASQNDSAQVTVTFLAADGTTVLGTTVLGGPTAAQRGNISELIASFTSAGVIEGTRSIRVDLVMTRAEGSYNDGYADNISVHLAGLARGQVLVSAPQNFSAENIARASGISFLQDGASATFASSQFGLGLIANAALIEGSSALDTLVITLAPGAVFSAGRFSFASWTDGEDSLVFRGSSGAESLAGSDMADQIILGAGADIANGGAGDDMLDGSAGRDRLRGGAGADEFILSSTAASRDTIADLVVGKDRLIIDAADFGAGLLAGALAAAAFTTGAAGQTTTTGQRFSYDAATGRLYFDADGSGAASAALHIATLIGLPDLAATDFLIV